jgi:hypothetical protein
VDTARSTRNSMASKKGYIMTTYIMENFLCVEEIGFSLKSGVKIMDGGLKPREKSCTQISSIIFPFVFNPRNNFSPLVPNLQQFIRRGTVWYTVIM